MSKKEIPGLVQIVVYLCAPLSDMLQNDDMKFNKKQNEFLQNKKFSLPYYSQEVFETEEEAKKFIPIFITELVKKQLLPKEVILPDKQLNKEICRVGFTVLKITKIETKPEKQFG